jgi:hypothetical protein
VFCRTQGFWPNAKSAEVTLESCLDPEEFLRPFFAGFGAPVILSRKFLAFGSINDRVAAPVSSYQVVARDLLDKVDDASPQFWLYPHERLGEREPICRR